MVPFFRGCIRLSLIISGEAPRAPFLDLRFNCGFLCSVSKAAIAWFNPRLWRFSSTSISPMFIKLPQAPSP